MQRKILIFPALLISILAITHVSPTVKDHAIATTSPDVQNEVINFQMDIHILDISQNNRTAEVRILLRFINFPYNATQVNAIVNGTGGTEVRFQCKTNGGYVYYAESNVTTWFLIGYGERYPFDSYEMDFGLEADSVHFLNGNSSYRVDPNDAFNLNQTEVLIPGRERRHLRDAWWITIPRQTPTGFIANVQRNWQLPTFQLILPIIACFYLLGGTMFIDRKDLQSRMTAYVSLFVFVPVFLMTIQDFLPYRSGLCFPEALLTILLTGTVTLAIFSMWPEDHLVIPIKKSRAETDATALFIALSIFLIIYSVLFYLGPQMFTNVFVSFLLVSAVLGYVFGWFFMKRPYIDKTHILEGIGYGLTTGGYVTMVLGFFSYNFLIFLIGIIIIALAIALLVVSRWLKKRRRPFPPHEAIDMDYIC